MSPQFLATPEANVETKYKEKLLESESHETIRSEIYTGRPARSIQTPYNLDWSQREAEMRDLLQAGKIPMHEDMRAERKRRQASSTTLDQADTQRSDASFGAGLWRDRRTDAANTSFDTNKDFLIAGQAVGGMREIAPAAEVVARLMRELSTALMGTLSTHGPHKQALVRLMQAQATAKI
eukprot:COSAG01_NODE_3597_length_5894_cov_1.898188_5_plen_180_part_00